MLSWSSAVIMSARAFSEIRWLVEDNDGEDVREKR